LSAGKIKLDQIFSRGVLQSNSNCAAVVYISILKFYRELLAGDHRVAKWSCGTDYSAIVGKKSKSVCGVYIAVTVVVSVAIGGRRTDEVARLARMVEGPWSESRNIVIILGSVIVFAGQHSDGAGYTHGRAAFVRGSCDDVVHPCGKSGGRNNWLP